MAVRYSQPRWNRPATASLRNEPRSSPWPTSVRSEAEDMLRDLAYVYKLTATIRQEIEDEQTPHARVSLN